MIKIFILDDHQLFIDGLKMILAMDPEFEVVGEANTGEEGLKLMESIDYDVLLTDYSMSGMSGFEVVKVVREKYPHVKIITLTMHSEIEYIDKMTNAGSLGYLMKNTGRKELKEAIEAVMNNQSYYSPLAKKTILDRYTQSLSPKPKPKLEKEGQAVLFTRREKQILRLLMEGIPSKEIADALCMSYHTVSTHRRNISGKIAQVSDLTVLQYVKEYHVLDDN